MKRALVLICCFAMLLTTLVGCGLFGKEQDNNESDSNNGDVITEEGTDKDGYVNDSIGDVKFNGQEIYIMAWGNEAATYDFNQDTSTGDKIAKQTFTRNNSVATRLKVKLKFDTELQGHNHDRANYIAKVEQNLGAGVKYDIIACYSQCSANFAMDGFLLDLKEYGDIIELSKPWWSANMVKSSVINDKLYFASGSIAATSILQTFVLAVNMDKIAQLAGKNDPRELVKQDKWTLEAFYNICKDAYANVNEDDPNKDIGDEFGFSSMDDVVGDGFFTGVGMTYLTTDNTGKLILSPDFEGMKTDNLVAELMSKFNGNDYMYAGGIGIFNDNRAIIHATSFWQLMKEREKIKFNYGYVPFPMLDEYQDEYYSTTGFPFTMWSITTACDDEAAERAAYTMEALASAGYRTVQPEVYNSIKSRLGDDAVNKEMFNIIIESRVYDLGRIYHNVFAWEDSPVALFRTRLYNGYEDGQGWSSIIAGHKYALNEGLASINSAFGY